MGLLVLELGIPAARSLKDRRRAVVGLRDRIRARFDVSCHELWESDQPTSARLLVTTGGMSAEVLEPVLDKVERLAGAAGDVVLRRADRDIVARHVDFRGLS